MNQQTQGKNESPRRKVVYKIITIAPDFRGQGQFGRGQYSSNDCDFDFPGDGSVIVTYRASANDKIRKFVRYTAGQWFGEGEVTEG